MVILAIFIGISLLITLVVQQSIQAQRQGGGPRGRFSGGMMVNRDLPLAESWGYVCFDLNISDEALLKARDIYQKAWNQRKELVKKAEEASGDQEAMQKVRSEAEEIRSEIAGKLKDILTSEQMKKFDEWEKNYLEQMRRPPGPPGGMPR
jgi:hypothetical protein